MNPIVILLLSFQTTIFIHAWKSQLNKGSWFFLTTSAIKPYNQASPFFCTQDSTLGRYGIIKGLPGRPWGHFHSDGSNKPSCSLEDINFNATIQKLPKSSVLISITLPGKTMTQYWDLTLEKLKNNATLGYNFGFNKERNVWSTLDIVNPSDKIKTLVFSNLINDLIKSLSSTHNLKIIGNISFTKPIFSFLKNLTRSSPLQFELKADVWPEVIFKKSYKELELKVPRPPYPNELMWNLTLEHLRLKHSEPQDIKTPRPAQWKDLVHIDILDILEQKEQGVPGNPIELLQLERGPVQILMEKNWNPEGLCENLLGASENETRIIEVKIPAIEEENKKLSSDFSRKFSFLSSKDPYSTSTEDYQMIENALKNTFDQIKTHEKSLKIQNVMLKIKLIKIQERIPPILDDKFFMKLCNQSMDEIKDEIESSAISKLELSSHKARRGAVERALLSIIKIEFPESYLEEQLKNLWNKTQANKEVNNYDTSLEYPSYESWKERSLEPLLQDLRLAFAIRHIHHKEKIQINEDQIIQNILLMKHKVPMSNLKSITEWAYRSKETEAVYDWIANHANITYYVDNRPIKLSISNPGTNLPNASLVEYPKGTSKEEYEKETKKLFEKAENLLFLKGNLRPT